MFILAAYQRMLNKRPLLTQMISAGVIGSAGDATCQLLVQKHLMKESTSDQPYKFDFVRCGRFFVLPCFFIAPTLSLWFRVLERVKGSKNILPLKKMLIDQTCFAPFFASAIIINLRILEGNSPRDAFRKMRSIYWEIYSRSLMYWPLVQLLNFYAIPLNFRVVFVQLAALGWNMFLSYKTQNISVEFVPLE